MISRRAPWEELRKEQVSTFINDDPGRHSQLPQRVSGMNWEDIQPHIDFQAELARLPGRTIEESKALHYLEVPAGVLCLDLGLTAASTSELDNLVATTFLCMSPLDTFTGSDPETWMLLANGTDLIARYWLCKGDAPFNFLVSLHRLRT